MRENKIVEIGGNVYVINKKPVYIYPGALDLCKAADVDEICRLVCDADMAESLNCFGEDTMLVLGTEPEDGHYNISIGDIETLPDDIQKKVRLIIQNQIVQIATDVSGRYDVYVVNGKPIGIENHIMDLNDPDDLSAVICFAKEASRDPSLPAIYGDDTIYILVPSGEKLGKATVAISDMTGLPDDIVKKVKAVMARWKR